MDVSQEKKLKFWGLFFWIFVILGGGGEGLRMCVMMCCALMCLNAFSSEMSMYVDIKEKTYPNDLCILSSLMKFPTEQSRVDNQK